MDPFRPLNERLKYKLQFLERSVENLIQAIYPEEVNFLATSFVIITVSKRSLLTGLWTGVMLGIGPLCLRCVRGALVDATCRCRVNDSCGT